MATGTYPGLFRAVLDWFDSNPVTNIRIKAHPELEELEEFVAPSAVLPLPVSLRRAEAGQPIGLDEPLPAVLRVEPADVGVAVAIPAATAVVADTAAWHRSEIVFIDANVPDYP